MGHSVNIRTFAYKGTDAEKKTIQAELDREAMDYSDNHTGLPGRIQWEGFREFNSYEEAEKYLQNHPGFYYQGAVKYKSFEKKENAKSKKLTLKKDELIKKLDEMRNKLQEYVEKHDVKKRKSQYVGCPSCGSKLNKNYIQLQRYSQKCPCCGTDLLSTTVQERIKEKKESIENMTTKINKVMDEVENSMKSKDFTWKWAVKYEYHV